MESNESYNRQNDGFFDIEYSEDGVYVVVNPPVEDGKAVEPKKIIKRLERKKVTDYDIPAIEKAVLEAEKKPIKIAGPQEEKKIDASIEVDIIKDGMSASIYIIPPDGGKMLKSDKIEAILKENEIVFGINNDRIKDLSENPIYESNLKVAEGVLPQDGENGKVEYFVELEKKREPKRLEDGTVDYRELGLINNVKKEQKLCEIIPPTKGTEGMTVTGKTLPAKDGKPAGLPKGKNVSTSEDGMFLFSTIDGQINFQDGKINVLPVYEVPEDVDNSTGNIKFIGNVVVKGNVISGFEIDAEGDVEVMGVVESADIKAGGDIILKTGMFGGGKGKLISGKDIVAKYIENSIIEAKNDIKADAVMHSEVKCGNILELSGKKGLLVGGTARVGKKIIARTIGSQMYTPTAVEVGNDPEKRERHKQIKIETDKLENDLIKTEKAIETLTKMEKSGIITEEKKELLNKSIRAKDFISSKINELDEEMEIIEALLENENIGTVEVSDNVYTGVKISIGTAMTFIKDTINFCRIFRKGGDIEIGPLN